MSKQLFAPRADRSAAAHIAVHEMGEGEVRWSPAGGGFVRATPRSYFDEVYSILTAEEIEVAAVTFEPGRFEIEDLGEVEGFTNGETWNGWEKPWFTKEVMIDKVIPLHNSNEVLWSEELGTFVLVTSDDDEMREAFVLADHMDALRKDGQIEIKEGEWLQASVSDKRTITADGREIEIFLVDYGFCWDRVDTLEKQPGPTL